MGPPYEASQREDSLLRLLICVESVGFLPPNTFIASAPPAFSVTNMPLCEICGMDVQELHDCKECQAKFCSECGNIKRGLCYDCLGWNDDEIGEDWREDDFGEQDLN